MSLNVLGQIQNVKDDAEAIKEEVAKGVKGVATDIKEIIREENQNLLKELKEHVTKKAVEKTEEDNLSYPEKPNFCELYLFGFSYAFNVLNSGWDKFEVTSEHKDNAQSTIFCCFWHLLKLLIFDFDDFTKISSFIHWRIYIAPFWQYYNLMLRKCV